MIRKLIVGLVAILVVQAASTPAASAQTNQSVSFHAGYFALRAEDARPVDDVLVQNLGFLAFDLSELSGATVGGDWLVGIGDHLEAGVGLGYYRRTTPSVYRDFVDADGTEIAQEMKLRVTPLTFTVRFLPLGRRGIQPYIGAGVGVFNWRYAETGEFVDFSDNSIFRASFVDDGNEVGPVVLGGLRIPVGDAFAVGGEVRYQQVEATLAPDVGFLGTVLDLGGFTSVVTVQIRF